MEHQSKHQKSRRQKWAFWGLGLGSLAWLVLRSGTKPRRLAYPCQRAALTNSVGFLGYLASVLGLRHFYHRLKHKVTLSRATFFGLALALVALLTTSNLPLTPVFADLTLPAWTSPTAISDVFAVSGMPTPECSLDGGALPTTPPCNVAAYALHDAGVDSLIAEMETQGTYFYRAPAHPDGIVGANDVVVIKINNQWAYNGTPQGRLCTNSDTLKGVIWRILQHPDTFSGEIVVAENTQGVVWDWDITPANAQDTNQSYQDVISAFQGLGYPVSLYRWDDLNGNLISGGNVNGAGYPTGEYASGDASDAYILLEDTEGAATNELSYPKFQTAGGISVSMRYGVWNGATYNADRLTFINMPVLKQHGMAGATIAWKNLIGFLTIENNLARFGEAGDEDWQAWDKMHGFFWGYQDLGDTSYGLLGRQMAYIRTPDLNVVDAIWIANDNYDGAASRQNILLASTDPFAVDWYASEYVLYAFYANQDASAARSGVFRNATRVNQNAAAAEWSGTYPYIDLLDTYDGDTPSTVERNQMNVYVVGGGTACDGITDAGITGGTDDGYTDTPYTFTAVVTPTNASLPITYTWTPAPDSGQNTASANYTWATAGVKTVNLAVENCGGRATITRTVTIEEAPACAYPLETASIAGPTSGYTDTLYTFIASITPTNASTPLTYTWTPAPDSEQGNATVHYTWTTTGTKTITLLVENCGGSDTPTHGIIITERPILSHFIFLPLALRNYNATPVISGDLIQPDDLTYLGAFRLPGGDEPPQTFAYGGNAMTYNPDNNTLFIAGHDRMAYGDLPDGDQIAEVSIPAPVNSRNPEDLNYAAFIQDFHNPTAGYFTNLEEIPKVGLQYLNHPPTGPLLHIAWGNHLQAEGEPSHGWFNATLADPQFKGVWFIGNQNLYSVNGYMLDIPAAWAEAYAQGRYLATGRMRDGGQGGMGPTLFAYRPWLSNGSAPLSGTHLAETTLLLYENVYNTDNIERALNGYQHPDEWEGAAWLTTATGKGAVLFAGTKGTGTKYWYGFINAAGPEFPCIDTHADFTACRLASGSPCPLEDMTGCCEEGVDCASGRGWWSARFDAQLILYDPAQLAQVATGQLESWQPQPYAIIDIDEHLYLSPPEWDAAALGPGDQRRNRIGDAAYDAANGYLYVLELYGDGAKPMVHVWQAQ